MPSKFAFDLDHIDQVTARVRGFIGFLDDHLQGLDRRVEQLLRAGTWTGDTAQAYAQAHREWSAAAMEAREGLSEMEMAAQHAREQYAAAMDANKRMTGG